METMSTSSIDDLLMGAKSPQHPQTPEYQHLDEPAEIEELEADSQSDEELTPPASSESNKDEADKADEAALNR
jgi:hypothetical protein